MPTRATGNPLFVSSYARAHDPCRRVALRARLINFETSAAVTASDAAFGIGLTTGLGTNHCIYRDGNAGHQDRDEEEDVCCCVHEEGVGLDVGNCSRRVRNEPYYEGMNEPILEFRRLSSHAVVPAYQSEHAAGMDLHAAIESPVELSAGSIELISCGFAMAIPPGWEAQVRPRSGLATKHGISMPNTPGTIDADYRGEVRVPLINLGQSSFTVENGMRIAQMVIAPVARVRIEVVEELKETLRGTGGFGSTGS